MIHVPNKTWSLWVFFALLAACQIGEASLSPTNLPIASSSQTQITGPTISPALLIATPIPPSSTPESLGRLAFGDYDFGSIKTVGPGTGPVAITLVNSDGSGVERPTFLEPYTQTPDKSSEIWFYGYVDIIWSPDAQSFVFVGFPPDGQSLQTYGAFGLRLIGGTQLFLANIATKEVFPLTTPGEYYTPMLGRPSWSPDGRYISIALAVVDTDSNGNEYRTHSLFKIDVKTYQRQRLTKGLSTDIHPTWSPDGQTIAFVRYISKRGRPFYFPDNYEGNNQASLMIVHSDGTGLVSLIDSIYIEAGFPPERYAPYSAPAWSPNGQWLAFLTGKEQPDIEIVNVNTGATHLLASSPFRELLPAWSPDGVRLTFVTDRDENDEVYTVTADGAQLVNLTQSAASDIYPVWSPDGRQIAFLSNREGKNPALQEPGLGYKLYVMNADGTGQVKVSDSSVFKPPAWQPHP